MKEKHREISKNFCEAANIHGVAKTTVRLAHRMLLDSEYVAEETFWRIVETVNNACCECIFHVLRTKDGWAGNQYNEKNIRKHCDKNCRIETNYLMHETIKECFDYVKKSAVQNGADLDEIQKLLREVGRDWMEKENRGGEVSRKKPND